MWTDRNISAGLDWENEINKRLAIAQVILLLTSPDFLASDYCYKKELQKAMGRHEKGEARVIPIILRPASWQGTPLGKLQALPTDGRPITDARWSSQDEAFHDVVEGIRKVVEELFFSQMTPSMELWQAQRSPKHKSVAIIDPAVPSLAALEAGLIGRRELLRHLRSLLCTRTGSLAFRGMYGIGKTTLVTELAHDYKVRKCFPDGILWAGLGQSPVCSDF